MVILTPVDPYPPPITAESMVVTALAAEMAVALGRARVKLLIEVVPVVAPKVTVVAALPIFKVVAVVLKRFPVVWVVANVPELALILPVAVMVPSVEIFPFAPVKVKWVEVISLAPKERALTISGSDKSMALVIAPAAD